MTPMMIRITLQSAATFGRGDGVPGLVDREIEHDKDGFPFLRGKTLKGLLAESAENILFALKDGKDGQENPWRKAKNRLFGMPGRGGSDHRGILHIGNAQLPPGLRAEVLDHDPAWTREEVLYSLTGIRRQTAINEDGGPEYGTLRSMRVLLPGVTLEALLDFDDELGETDLQLLTAAVLGLRRVGTGRNRGRGKLTAELVGADMRKAFKEFGEAI